VVDEIAALNDEYEYEFYRFVGPYDKENFEKDKEVRAEIKKTHIRIRHLMLRFHLPLCYIPQRLAQILLIYVLCPFCTNEVNLLDV
jgi:hypothetical protein